jgi:squalene-hopene/tetraprenyl-beta-curcumene cyclase
LPGGVPDADDTPGALLALRSFDTGEPGLREAAAAGIDWLLKLQNRDGGIPTFCRGWGKLPFDRSSPDLTAHAIRAWTAWHSLMPPPLQHRIAAGIDRAVEFLARTQRADGAWIPLWFGHQEDSADENPLYGTARVVPALVAVADSTGAAGPLALALRWLVTAQSSDGGWSGASGAASSTEETGVALEALALAWEKASDDPTLRAAIFRALTRGAAWLAAAVESGRWRDPAPIGFYFAKLWYFERLYPQIFATGALVRLARIQDPIQTELTTKHTKHTKG